MNLIQRSTHTLRSCGLKGLFGKMAHPSFVNIRETLFLPPNRTSSLNHYNISKLFVDAIQFCYSQISDLDHKDFHTNSHQLRSISVSLTNLGRTALEQIVLALRCKSAKVFIDFHFKSLAFFSENLYGLAPLVVFGYKHPAAGGPVVGFSV